MIFGVIKPYPSPIISGRGVDVDFPMLAGCLALLGLGLVMITSASSEVAALQSGNTLYHMIRHLFYIVLGLGACIMTMMVPIAHGGSRFHVPRNGGLPTDTTNSTTTAAPNTTPTTTVTSPVSFSLREI